MCAAEADVAGSVDFEVRCRLWVGDGMAFGADADRLGLLAGLRSGFVQVLRVL